ncbi:hypothetical protein HDU67_001449, partial [Dinochytrium kinnereticum]
ICLLHLEGGDRFSQTVPVRLPGPFKRIYHSGAAISSFAGVMPRNHTYAAVVRALARVGAERGWGDSWTGRMFPLTLERLVKVVEYLGHRVVRGDMHYAKLLQYLSALGSYHRAEGWEWRALRNHERVLHALSNIRSYAPLAAPVPEAVFTLDHLAALRDTLDLTSAADAVLWGMVTLAFTPARGCRRWWRRVAIRVRYYGAVM